jgi:hypothetical protein
VNVRKDAKLESDVTGNWLELDIWLPHLNLAFEYQVLLFCFVLFCFFLSLLMCDFLLNTSKENDVTDENCLCCVNDETGSTSLQRNVVH